MWKERDEKKLKIILFSYIYTIQKYEKIGGIHDKTIINIKTENTISVQIVKLSSMDWKKQVTCLTSHKTIL